MTEYEPLYSILSGSEDYVRLKDSLASSEGPVSVFGLGESERTHISCFAWRHNAIYCPERTIRSPLL